MTPSWRTIFTACEALDAEDPAWDSVDGFVEAVSTLASIRRAERERIESARREAVAIARARLASVVDATRSAPGCERVAAEMDRVLAGHIAHERALELAEAATSFGTSVGEVAALRAKLVERVQAGAAAAEMETLVHDLRAREVDQASRTDSMLALLEAAGVDASPYDVVAPRTGPPASIDGDPTIEEEPEPPVAIDSSPTVEEEPEPAAVPAPEFAPEMAIESVPELEPARVAEAAPAAGPGDVVEAERALVPEPGQAWLSRSEAETRYPDPVATLCAPGALTGFAAEIATLWNERDLKKSAHRDRLRRIFFEVSGGGAIGASLAHVENKYIRIDLDALRAGLEAEGGDPARVAALDGFDTIIFASAPLSEGLSPSAFVSNLLGLAASEGNERAIRVFLAPHLPAAHREEALRKFHSNGIRAAILDDVDACRLLTPGAELPYGLHGMLGLVAIVSEQLHRAAGAA